MIPILYEKNEVSFATNGLGRLRDCISCIVTEERNGVYECDFEYPVDGAHFNDIICGRIIGVEHDDTNDLQPFDIVSYSKPIDGVVSFHAVHISYRQSYMTVSGTNINSIADAFTLLQSAQPSNPFRYWTDQDGETGYMAAADGVPRSVRQMLGGVEGSILDTYRGEFEWDKFTVKLWEHRGVERPFSIRYGINMTDYNEDTDYSETYTSVIPYWAGSDENGNDIIVTAGKTDSGASSYTGRDHCVPLDLSAKFENQPSTADLQTMARSMMSAQNPNLPSQSISVSFIRLQDSAEYAYLAPLLKCRLCDTIKVEFPRYGMRGTYKIVKTVWDVLAERYTEMELGTLSATLADALGISNGISESSQPSGIIESGTDGIWTWRKWADGTAECWGQNSVESAWATWGGHYYTTTYSQPTFPSGLFINAPTVSVSKQGGADATIVFSGTVTTTGAGSVYLLRPASAETGTYIIGYYAIGKWK